MTVLDRSELQASPLADLHLIADQIGLEGFRRLRKADLIDAILGEKGPAEDADAGESDNEGDGETPGRRPRTRRPSRSRRAGAGSAKKATESEDEQPAAEKPATARGTQRASGAQRASGTQRGQSGRARGEREKSEDGERVVEGVVEVMGNGSAFLRVVGPEPSDGDVYVSAAQVRRCELVSGDRVSGPVRTPRRSERYCSLVRIDTD